MTSELQTISREVNQMGAFLDPQMAGDSYDITLSIYIYTFIHSMNPVFRNQSHGKLARARHSLQEAIQSTIRWRSDLSCPISHFKSDFTFFCGSNCVSKVAMWFINQQPELQSGDDLHLRNF